MSRKPASPATSDRPAAAGTAPEGERIAKVLSRAGIASRREAERLIAEGRVKVNGKPIDSPALNVAATDRILVDGKPVAEPAPPRLWLYHKPPGLVTSARDEKGRRTVFDALPADMPRVMSVGRLDLTSEGLLLLTNDGALKRRLELPSTGWLRRYRVRINGTVSEASLEQLRAGITVEGVSYQPMTVTFDRQQGANAWLTIGLREGKNREIRKALGALGVVVNRLIRVSYGPFQLGNLKEGEVEEVRGRVLREQLGTGAAPDAKAGSRSRAARRTRVLRRRDEDKHGQGSGVTPGEKPGVRPDAKPAAKAGAAPGARPTARPGPKSGPKSGPGPGPRPGPKPTAPAGKKRPQRPPGGGRNT